VKLKENLKVSSEDFWYDLTDGGYIKPREICYFVLDAEKVERAIEVIKEFQKSCEKQIKDFVQ